MHVDGRSNRRTLRSVRRFRPDRAGRRGMPIIGELRGRPESARVC